jgi:hypothetical protein
MTQAIEQHKVISLRELRGVLDRMSNNALHQIDNELVNITGGPITVRLECEKLTDGSEVYNLTFKL